LIDSQNSRVDFVPLETQNIGTENGILANEVIYKIYCQFAALNQSQSFDFRFEIWKFEVSISSLKFESLKF
jgi:hypothetical protein